MALSNWMRCPLLGCLMCRADEAMVEETGEARGEAHCSSARCAIHCANISSWYRRFTWFKA